VGVLGGTAEPHVQVVRCSRPRTAEAAAFPSWVVSSRASPATPGRGQRVEVLLKQLGTSDRRTAPSFSCLDLDRLGFIARRRSSARPIRLRPGTRHRPVEQQEAPVVAVFALGGIPGRKSTGAWRSPMAGMLGRQCDATERERCRPPSLPVPHDSQPARDLDTAPPGEGGGKTLPPDLRDEIVVHRDRAVLVGLRGETGDDAPTRHSTINVRRLVRYARRAQ
jgi:hypothetical protein